MTWYVSGILEQLKNWHVGLVCPERVLKLSVTFKDKRSTNVVFRVVVKTDCITCAGDNCFLFPKQKQVFHICLKIAFSIPKIYVLQIIL